MKELRTRAFLGLCGLASVGFLAIELSTASCGIPNGVGTPGTGGQAGTTSGPMTLPNGCPIPPGGGICDVTTQCGCSAGQKCAREDGHPEACEDVGTGATGSTCTADADCGAADVCVGALCQPLCQGNCPGADHVCLEITYQGADLGYAACEPHCSVLNPAQADGTHAACSSDQTCAASMHTVGATYCVKSTGSAPEGASCANEADCIPGSSCIPLVAGDTTGYCRQNCFVGVTTCSAGLTCAAFSPSEPLDGQILGVCIATPPATCGSGTFACGTTYCSPNGTVCCASVGRPDRYCPGGETCHADGSCSSGGSSGGTCGSGMFACGSYCDPNGTVCCAPVGRSDRYCPAGEACNSDGSCSAGSSGGSGSGTGGQCESLNSCISATDTISQSGSSCSAEEIDATLVNNCGQSAYCRLCPTVAGAIDESRCEAFNVASGATSRVGQYWCNADGIRFLCAPSTENQTCVQF